MQCEILLRAFVTVLGLLAGATPVGAAEAEPHETVLLRFHGGADGYFPSSTLVGDAEGNLYGTSSVGGGTHCKFYAEHGCGLVFELSPPQGGKATWTETILYRFVGGNDGAFPGTPFTYGT